MNYENKIVLITEQQVIGWPAQEFKKLKKLICVAEERKAGTSDNKLGEQKLLMSDKMKYLNHLKVSQKIERY